MPQVSEVMVTDVVTIESSASIMDAAKQMIQQEKGPLPVMEGGQLHGMITDRDLVAHVLAEGRDPSSLTVHDVATHELVTVEPNQSTVEAQELMYQHGLDRLLVVEGDQLVGLISGTDIRSHEGLVP